ncbi:uncharacterized protein CLUP02_08574 [Colletotrichum lupini]|uniref:Nitrogen regulatory protein areA GATA-like domain-containing protein n=2 Tax=Colletotrichum acutatum species complex TaxID=2707335 RepID=A0A9Q8STC3_9PEZI|nr:uncharacterized protein CLUP02_08574 [Colletotrichum lupini]KAK1446296.1 hypothetical protein CMEL01_10539 [Colletotrichum melonis]UQC83083.1 hypothetical protein CLUP02_08574 [Colletotrichum lupini]
MDLPKGLVKDDRRIYEDVAALTQPLPPDFIIRMWRLYTTTNLKLVDPTARRLENLWWHVMGSDRSKLKAATVAKIWEHISYGPTFVPLKGSPNRWEGPSTPRFNSQHESDPVLSAQQMNQDIKMISEQSALKELSASSSRPPPPHPILKKHRGDSKSGPRPTARFVSPHESADEDYQTSDETSSGSTGASGLEMRTSSTVSPAKSSKKKPSTPTKRFVASASGKRRPVLPRRMSSQSSTNSDVGIKEPGSANGGKHVGTYNVMHPHAEESAILSVSGSEGFEMPPPSAKALGKRPVERSISESPRSVGNSRPTEERRKPVLVQTANRAPAPEPLSKSATDRSSREAGTVKAGGPRTPTYIPAASPALSSPRIGSFSSARSGFSAPRMERAPSNSESYRPREASFGRGSAQGLISSATASTSNIAAMGQVTISGEPDRRALETLEGFQDESGPRGNPRRISSSSHFAPTMPSSTPDVPLARTRSQLTLLLEREKERTGDRPRHRS